MALPPRTVILGSPPSPTHKVDPLELADLLESMEVDVDVATDAAAVAEAAKTAAETARDAAFVNADVYSDTAAGLAATSIGDQFQVVSGNEIIRYRHDSGPVATEVVRYANSDRVTEAYDAAVQPAWVGRKNGWADPFFRKCIVGVDFLDRARWFGDAAESWSLVDNMIFDGKALQTDDNGTGFLHGPVIWLDEIGAVAGDTVEIYCLMTGTGVTGRFYGSQIDSTGSSVGSQLTGLLDDGASISLVTSGTPGRFKISFTVSAGAERVRLFPYVSTGAGTGTIELVALWAHKGAGPNWPIVEYDEFASVYSNKVPSLQYRADVGDLGLDQIYDVQGTVEASAESITLAATNPQLDGTYGDPFDGWGEAYTPAGISFNAVRIKALGRNDSGIDATEQWQEIHVVVRTGANAHLAGAPIVATGKVRVPPSQSQLYNIDILLKDPDSGFVKTLTDADFDTQYFVGVYARRANGDRAYMSMHRAELSNTVGQSYYFSHATRDPQTTAWAPFTSNWRLGFDHLLLTDPQESADLTIRQAFIAEAQGDLYEANQYMLNVFEEIASDASSTTLAVTSTSGAARNLPFSGWGARYSPAGISFNAVEVVAIARTEGIADAGKWDYLKVVIRTGSGSQIAGSTVVAVGETRVNRQADILNNIKIILRDPSTGAVKTITDADLDAEYFIGIYARTLSGGYAACGEHRGTQSNFINESYYITTADPITGGWSDYTSDTALGVNHLLLTNPQEVLAFAPTTEFANDVLGSVTAADLPSWIPPTFYITEGVETSIYFDNLIAADWDDFNWSCNGYARGDHQHERWAFDLSSSEIVDDASASIAFYEKVSEDASQTLNLAFEASLASAGSGTTPRVIYIGDSLTNAGVITQTLLDNASADVMGVSLIGTRGSGSNLHEGRGGYTINDYSTIGRTYYEFTVSGVAVAPAINSSEYSHNGSVYRVQEIELDGSGNGTITCSVVSGGAPLASGTLTKTFGIGDASINFSASAATSGNPFWIGGQVNFGSYLSINGFSAPDWAFIQLGTNDCFGQTSDAGVTNLAASEFSKLDTLIASIKAANPSTKVALVPIPPPAGSQDAFAANYGAAYKRWRVKRNYILWAREMVAKYGGEEANRIFICPAGLNWDTQNNVQRAASAPVNSRSSVNVTRQSNGVHPSSDGYQQIGDAVWAFLKCQA